MGGCQTHRDPQGQTSRKASYTDSWARCISSHERNQDRERWRFSVTMTASLSRMRMQRRARWSGQFSSAEFSERTEILALGASWSHFGFRGCGGACVGERQRSVLLAIASGTTCGEAPAELAKVCCPRYPSLLTQVGLKFLHHSVSAGCGSGVVTRVSTKVTALMSFESWRGVLLSSVFERCARA